MESFYYLKFSQLHTMYSQSTIYTINTDRALKCSFLSSNICLTYDIPKTKLRRLGFGPIDPYGFKPIWFLVELAFSTLLLYSWMISLFRVIHCMNMVNTAIFSFKHYVTNNFMSRQQNVSFSRSLGHLITK